MPEAIAAKIGEVLDVKIHRTTICGTSLIGIFCAGNDHALLVPSIIFESELQKLKHWGIPYKIIDTKWTALGNNMLCNNEGCLVNPNFSARNKKLIRQALQVKLKPGRIAELPTVGSLGIANKHGCFLHKDAKQAEIEYLEDLLGVKSETGTINRGSPYVKSGILVNDRGLIVSDLSWGPEIGMADESLFPKRGEEHGTRARESIAVQVH